MVNRLKLGLGDKLPSLYKFTESKRKLLFNAHRLVNYLIVKF